MSQRGIINTIILIIVALVILGYFNVDLKAVFSMPAVKANLGYAWDLAVQGFIRAKDALVQFIPILKQSASSQ